MKDKKHTVIRVLVRILIMALVVGFVAYNNSASAQEPYVYDYADLLTDEEEATLSILAEKQSLQYGISITFLTYDDSEGKSTMVYTDDFYDQIIVEPNGFLLAIDMDNREVYLNTVGTCIDNISDYEVDEILDYTYMYASDAEYADFFAEAMDFTLDAYNGSLAVNGDADYYAEPTPVNPLVPTSTSLVITVVVMVITAVVLLLIHNKNNRAPSAENYMGSSFEVLNSNTLFMGTRREVLHDYYADNDSDGGGSSHISGGGISHGGGGRGF